MPLLPYLVTAIGLGSFLIGALHTLRGSSNLDVFCANASASRGISLRIETRLLQHLAIRNLTLGLSILMITYYWRFMLSEAPFQQREGVQRVLGIILTIGWLISAADSYHCGAAANEIMENHDIVNEQAAFAQNMALLHRLRGFFWLGAGLWCLFGRTM